MAETIAVLGALTALVSACAALVWASKREK